MLFRSWTHTLRAMELLEGQGPSQPGQASLLAWATLLHDLGKPRAAACREDGRRTFYCHEQIGAEMAGAILTRLRFPSDFARDVSELVADHMRLASVFHMKDATLKRLVGKTLQSWPDPDPRARHYVHTLLGLHRLDCLASHGKLEEHDHARARIDSLSPGAEKPPRLVSGRDLLALGVPRGPVYRELLQVVEDAQLNGELVTREEAPALLTALAGERVALRDGHDA